MTTPTSIAVIDSGINLEETSIGGNLAGCYYVSDEAVSPRGPEGVRDEIGHGTTITNIIASINPEAKFSVYKVFDGNNRCSFEKVMLALAHLEKNPCKVVNLSLGTINPDYERELFEICEKLYYKGVVLISAGNEIRGREMAPAKFCSNLGVYHHNILDKNLFFFRRHGSAEFMAPGMDTVKGISFEKSEKKGTSFACAHMTGHASLITNTRPNITPFEIKAKLYERAQENYRQYFGRA